MSIIKKITFEYDDRITTIEGEEAIRVFDAINGMCVSLAIRSGNQNPFDHNPVKWEIKYKSNDNNNRHSSENY